MKSLVEAAWKRPEGSHIASMAASIRRSFPEDVAPTGSSALVERHRFDLPPVIRTERTDEAECRMAWLPPGLGSRFGRRSASSDFSVLKNVSTVALA